MPADLSVPDELALRLFLLGRLAGPEAERVERYLETHPGAADTARTLAADDTLTSALRDQPAADAADPEIQTAIARLERLADASERTTTRDGAGESQADPGEETEDALTFLAPAQGPGELGRLGGYRVLRVLGVGGMGMVLEADDPKLGRRVAIKVMRPRVAASPKAVRRFLQEARAAAAVEHDHIIPIWYVGEDNGVPYIVMPFLKGESLNARLNREDRLPAAEVVRVGVEAAEGLAAAHDQGLAHRDIKPANLWLEAPRGRVKVLDFGLARLAREDGRLTQTGAIVGTPAYMAPEQARGLAVDARGDLFSLGAVLYRAATGRNPFRGSDTLSMLTSLATDTPADPRALSPDLPPHLADLIVRLLQKDPARRPPSAREVVRLLAPPTVEALPDSGERRAELAFDDEPTQVEPPPPAPAGSPKRKRGRAGRFAGIAVALLALFGVGFGTYKLVFETKDGTLYVQIDDKETDARFKDGELRLYVGDELKYTVKPSEQNRKLPPGDYKVRVSDPNGLDVDTPEFTMKKGGQVTVRVTAKAADVAKRGPAGTGAADRRAAEYVLSVGGHVRIVENGQEGNPKAVAELPRGPFELRIVDLSQSRNVTDAGLAGLEDCKNLTHLFLDGTPVGDAGLGHLKTCTNLTLLSLKGTKVTAAGIAELQKALPHCKIDRDGGAVEPKSPDPDRQAAVWVLSIGGAVRVNGQDRDLRAAADLPAGLFRLTGVNLEAKPKADDAGLARFERCRHLQFLDLRSTGITDAGLAHLKEVADLRVLYLADTRVSNDGLATFRACTKLEELALDNTPVSDAGLAHFRDCKRLTFVVLGGTKVAGPGLAHLADCTGLRHLDLRETGVGDAALAPVRACRDLRHLYLTGTKVTDAGLAPFAACRALTHLAVQKTAVTARQVEALKAALPACRIEWDGGVVEPAGRLVEDFFTGTDLAGWVVAAGRLWAVKDGAVVGTAPKGFARAMSKTVYTAKTYRDFQLSCDVRRKGGHAVVLFRGAPTPAGDALTGGRWVLRPGGETLTVGTEDGTDREVVQRPDAKADDFNAVVLRVVGRRVTVTLNGKVGYDKELADLPADGVIGLRYGGPTEEVAFRNLRLVDLTRAEKK